MLAVYTRVCERAYVCECAMIHGIRAHKERQREIYVNKNLIKHKMIRVARISQY